MQGSWLPVIPFFLVHFAPVFTEVFVALNIQLHKVADFDWVDFSSAAVADLRQRHSNNSEHKYRASFMDAQIRHFD